MLSRLFEDVNNFFSTGLFGFIANGNNWFAFSENLPMQWKIIVKKRRTTDENEHDLSKRCLYAHMQRNS